MRSSVVLGVLAVVTLAVAACGGAVADPVLDKSAGAAKAADPPAEGSGETTPAKASEPETGDTCEEEYATIDCDTHASYGAGHRTCMRRPSGLAWTECYSNDSSTPLVVVFDGAPVTFASTPGTFDLAGDGASHATDWPTARTPWLGLDRDGNGRIDDGSELFGSMTRLGTGLRARNGFEALAELDSNHDGAITAEDADFGKLVLWSDADGDRVASTAEQRPASESLVRIELDYRNDPRCTRSGCEVERARLVYRDAAGAEHTGEVVDVHLRHH